MEQFDLTRYLDMADRRKYWMIIPFLLVVLGGFSYILWAPSIYEAETLILVQRQKVPENYVQEIVSTDLDSRLMTISQQVMSRTNLEKIIKQYHLFQDGDISLFEKVERMRKRINIEVSRGGRRKEAGAFTIAFRDSDPKTAMVVTNALASNFITENLKIREAQALGTSDFLADELAGLKRKLDQKEQELKDYRERYMGGLPEQLDSNLKILERLQGQLDQLQNNLRDAENRRIMLQKEIAEAGRRVQESEVVVSKSGEGVPRDITVLRNQLAALQAKYTENHPDVIRLKKMIADIEQRQQGGPGGPAETIKKGPAEETPLEKQLRELVLEISTLRSEIAKTKAQIARYQTYVENTPKREQELLSLKRDYDNLRNIYNSVLNRKLEAEIAVSMERKQKGEQFTVLDPARMPELPVEPNIPRIFLLTLVLAVGLGIGTGYLVEMLDTSFKDPDELEQALGLPVLLSMPIRYTEAERRAMKRKGLLMGLSIAVGFILCFAGIVVAFKGLDRTAYLARMMLSRLL